METILSSDFFRRKFDPKANIETCAHLIQQQLGLLNEDEISALKGRKLEDKLKNHKKILKLLIRIASESHDHRRTVDFISEKAANYLKKQCGEGKLLNRHLESDISHEHVVPCEAIYQKILVKNRSEIPEILKSLSFRALVLSEERTALDESYKSDMPKNWDADGIYAVLARYSHAGIDGQLHAISQRGIDLLKAWKKPAQHKDALR